MYSQQELMVCYYMFVTMYTPIFIMMKYIYFSEKIKNFFNLDFYYWFFNLYDISMYDPRVFYLVSFFYLNNFVHDDVKTLT